MTDYSPEKRAQIDAIKARLAAMKAGGGDAPAASAAPAAEAGGGDAPAGDQASQIAAIKARLAQAKAGGGGAPAAAASATATAAAPAAGGTAADTQSRIAELKAKMEAGKAVAKAKPAARAPAVRPGDRAKSGTKHVWPVQPIDHTSFGDDYLYGPTTLHKWFIAASILLTITAVGMWVRDWDRDWKFWQSAQREVDITAKQAEVAALGAAIDPADLAAFEQRVVDAEAAIGASQDQIDALQAQIDAQEGVAYDTNMEFQFAKSLFDTERFEFEEFRLSHGDDADALSSSEADFNANRVDMNVKEQKAITAALELDGLKGQLGVLVDERTESERALGALTEKRDLAAGQLAKIDHGVFNDYLRNAPMVDMLAPTLKIEKIITPHLKDNYNFMFVPRVDFCTTCHVGIDNKAMIDHDPLGELGPKGERVLNAHPRLDLFVSDSSPHPAQEFGCTICHQGRGQAVEFPRTFHTPSTDAAETAEEKEARWIADFGYQPDRHYWQWPMVPQDKIYSSCFQCHQETARLPAVPEYNHSRALVEELGCYGCHKIEGFEDYRKAGPDLTNITAKLDEGWVRKWVMDPKGFRASTRMPHFWRQSNRGGEAGTREMPRYAASPEWNNNTDSFVDDYRARDEVEARAITAYAFDRALSTSEYELGGVPNKPGNVANGKEQFEKRGCLGCHGVESQGWTASGHGPDLSAIGAKTNARWLYNWIQDPKRYYPTSVMPDLRLTPAEAWDITSWLMTLDDASVDGWLDAPEPRANAAILDGIAVEYKASLTSVALAEQDVAAMRADGGNRAVELYVGEKLFAHYGCTGCHLVPGHYDDKGVGTELTLEGLKEVTKFDFGFEGSHENPEHIGHQRHDWFRAKLEDTRIFDRMPVIGKDDEGHHAIERLDMKVKRPLEKLKMPNFYLTDGEVDLLVQFLMGLREEGIDPVMKPQFTAEQQSVESASRLMTEVNCIGCHRMGQTPQRVAYSEDLVEDGYENGVWMAAPLTVNGVDILGEGHWFSDLLWSPSEDDIYETVDFFDEEGLADAHVNVYGYNEGHIYEYIEDKALRPPVFNGQGDKVESDWLYDFLLEPFTVRNHVEVRMPTFGFTPTQSRSLAQWFAARDDQPWPFSTERESLDRDLLAEGARLFNEYQCNSCHPAGSTMPSNPDKLNWGPDLSMSAERLKGQWIEDWLHDPQLLQPGTKMPNFLGSTEEGVIGAEYEIYVDDLQGEMKALRHYLKFMQEWGGDEVSKG